MKVKLNRLNNAYHLEASNEDGNTIRTDGSPKIGGENLGMRPMQLMLAGIGSCSAIDVISILNKQKQDLQDIKIEVDGQREEGEIPALFTDIHLHYKLYGNLNKDKVEKALALSVDKYCSVARILEKTANVTYDYEILEAVEENTIA